MAYGYLLYGLIFATKSDEAKSKIKSQIDSTTKLVGSRNKAIIVSVIIMIIAQPILFIVFVFEGIFKKNDTPGNT